jgi:outer membrane protein OmpA-like peptidoglycan-associated protein
MIMKYQLQALSIGIVSVLAVGCASTPSTSQDIDRMRSLVSQAGSGADGACLVALHEAAVSLSEAKAILAKADTKGLKDSEYSQGIAAAENAINARKVIATKCTTRVTTLARQSQKTTAEIRGTQQQITALARQSQKTAAEIKGTQQQMQADIAGTQMSVFQTQAALVKLYHKTERLPGVTFKSDSAELREEAKPILDAIADRLVKENRRVEIAGHTSSTGSAEHNMTLSQGRADAVRDFLISRGVPESNLIAKGYGMNQPVATNDTQEGRNANKRVEIRYTR